MVDCPSIGFDLISDEGGSFDNLAEYYVHDLSSCYAGLQQLSQVLVL